MLMTVLLVLVSAVQSTGSIAKEGGAQPPRQVVEFGRRSSGERVDLTAAIHNTSGRTVTVKSLVANCGCVQGRSETPAVTAGGVLRLHISVDSMGLHGPFEKTVLVTTDDPDNPHHLIDVKGFFAVDDQHVRVNPTGFHLGEYRPGTRVERVIQLTRNGKVAVGDVEVRRVPEWLSVTVQRRTDRVVWLRAVARVPAGVSEYTDRVQLVVTTDAKGKAEELDVPVVGRLAPALVLSRYTLLAGPRAEALGVVDHAGNPVDVLAFDVEGERLSLESYVKAEDWATTGDWLLTFTKRGDAMASAVLNIWIAGYAGPLTAKVVMPPTSGATAADGQ